MLKLYSLKVLLKFDQKYGFIAERSTAVVARCLGNLVDSLASFGTNLTGGAETDKVGLSIVSKV